MPGEVLATSSTWGNSCSPPRSSATSTIMTLSAFSRNGSASRTARRASRTSFHAMAIRRGESEVNPLGTLRTGRPAFRIRLPGSRARNGSGVLAPIPDDDEIGGPRLPCNGFGRKIQDGSPFHPPLSGADGSAELLSFRVEQSPHVLQVRVARRRGQSAFPRPERRTSAPSRQCRSSERQNDRQDRRQRSRARPARRPHRHAPSRSHRSCLHLRHQFGLPAATRPASSPRRQRLRSFRSRLGLSITLALTPLHRQPHRRGPALSSAAFWSAVSVA